MKKVASPEHKLIKEYLEGNSGSLQKLIEIHQNRIYSYIFVMVKNKSLADDIFQDTFVKVINTLKSGSYSEEGKFIQWVMRIAHNLVIDHFRRLKKVNFAEPKSEQHDIMNNLKIAEQSIEETLINDQIHEDVRGLIKYLPEEQKEVLYLRCYAGLSFKDIAEQTEVSINTALGRMRYALINLRKIIDTHNIALTQ